MGTFPLRFLLNYISQVVDLKGGISHLSSSWRHKRNHFGRESTLVPLLIIKVVHAHGQV
jgi:hypothetical protein